VISPYGLSRCVQCNQVITNREANPCGACRVSAFIKERRPVIVLPDRVEVLDEPRDWDWGPRVHYSEVCRAIVVRVRDCWRRWSA
jgi:hypothetical protein